MTENKQQEFTDLQRDQDNDTKVTFNVKKNLEPTTFVLFMFI